MAAFLGRYDVILSPVYTHPALPHGASILEGNFHGFSHTMAHNMSGWPAAVVRCGVSATGLPIGVQIAAVVRCGVSARAWATTLPGGPPAGARCGVSAPGLPMGVQIAAVVRCGVSATGLPIGV